MKRLRIENAFHFNRWLNTKCLSMCFTLWFKHQFAADPSIQFFVQLPIEWGHDHNCKYFLTRLSNCNVDTDNAGYKKAIQVHAKKKKNYAYFWGQSKKVLNWGNIFKSVGLTTYGSKKMLFCLIITYGRPIRNWVHCSCIHWTVFQL